MNNETYDFEDRKYINPTVSRDEQLGFIDNFRDTQAQDLNDIVIDTHNLGTDVPSSIGGLNGATGMWNAQYLAPKMATMITSMKATAQAQALSDILANYQNQLKQRYNKAYRDYALKNAKNGNSTSSSGITVNDGVTVKNNGSSGLYGTKEKSYTEKDK
jgi:hypothetical protein